MKTVWALQEAKNRFSEVVNRAGKEGPQTITRRGRETAVLVSMDDYRKLTLSRGDLVDFLRGSPLTGLNLDLRRSRDPGRAVDL